MNFSKFIKFCQRLQYQEFFAGVALFGRKMAAYAGFKIPVSLPGQNPSVSFAGLSF